MQTKGADWSAALLDTGGYDFPAKSWGFDYEDRRPPRQTLPTKQILVRFFEGEIKALSELDDDWDFEGAKAPSEAQLVRLREAMNTLLAATATLSVPRMPIVSPCPNGSVDVFWKGADAQILINVGEEHDPIVTANVRGTRFRHTAERFAADKYDWGAVPSMLRHL